MLLLVGLLVGTCFGLFLARELRIYRRANGRGGEIDLTGMRPLFTPPLEVGDWAVLRDSARASVARQAQEDASC